MDTNKNSYTFIFATGLVVVVAFVLAYFATSLKPLQDANLKQEKMQNILRTVGKEYTREEALKEFTNFIKKGIVIDAQGNVIEEKEGAEVENSLAFTLELAKEVKKPIAEQKIPLYVAEVDGKTFYVIPLQGMGMWSDIWGNVAFADDKNTIVGVNFDHKSETSGLGAEIKTDWFQAAWVGKKILKDDNAGFTADNFASVSAIKGGADDTDPHGVDAISGGTVTSNATSDMFKGRIELYLPYFNNLK